MPMSLLLQPQLLLNPVEAVQDVGCPLLIPRLNGDLVVQRLQNDVRICCLRVNGYLLTRHGAELRSQLETPKHARAENEHLIIDDILAEASTAAPAEAVHTLAIAEVGIFRQRFLIGRPARLEIALGMEVLRIWVFGLNPVDGPAFELALEESSGRDRRTALRETYHSQARTMVSFLILTPRNTSSCSA